MTEWGIFHRPGPEDIAVKSVLSGPGMQFSALSLSDREDLFSFREKGSSLPFYCPSADSPPNSLLASSPKPEPKSSCQQYSSELSKTIMTLPSNTL